MALRPLLLSSLVLWAPAALAEAPRVACDTPFLVLGGTASTTCTVHPTVAGAPVRSAANVGRLEALPDTGDGASHFRYVPPEGRVPRVALLAFWQERGSEAPEVALQRLPLHGRMALQVRTTPGARVRVEVAGREFGPTRAAKDGRASVEVEVPPGTTSAAVHAHTRHQEKTTQVPIEVPATNPLLAVLTGGALAPTHPGYLWLAHAEALPGRQLEFVSRGVKLERLRFWRDQALFRVVPTGQTKTVRIEARLTEDLEAQAVVEAALTP